MLADDVIPFLGSPLDESGVESLFGERGQKMSTELDGSHPEDQRHYYCLSQFGVQFILDDNEIVTTIFFHIEGDKDMNPYPWSFRNGVTPSSTRKDMLYVLGTPERSGKSSINNQFATGGWDRFKVSEGLLHFQYNTRGTGISMVTAMLSEPTA